MLHPLIQSSRLPPRAMASNRRWPVWVALTALSVGLADGVQANGIFRNGAGARSMALGGAGVALPDQPLDALHANPAGLSWAGSRAFQLGGFGAFAEGDFANSVDANGELDAGLGALPEAALVWPLESQPVAFGLGVIPEGALSADWRFTDPPGGLDGVTSYGPQRHKSEIAVVRSSLGVSVKACETLSLGASVGLVYNRNRLESPYIFQSHPVLKGFKTLLDLETDGFGVNGSFGAVFRPNESLSFGASYQTETRIDTTGSASGNAAAQLASLGGAFAGVRPDFIYAAEVGNVFPQTVSGGVSWQAHERVRLVAQVDWINWSDSFDELPISLSGGNNADLNAFLGTDSIQDTVPLRWRDRFVYRAGIEFQASESFTLRGGYAFGENPVPAGTLTPMTAAIMEHTLTAGIEWRRGRFLIAGAYQCDLPTSQTVTLSDLAGGEYSNTRTELAVHWFGITTGWEF